MYKLIPHAADLRMKVRGATLEDLFNEALAGLMDVIHPGKAHTINAKWPIRIEAEDITNLLIDFLNEALTLSQTNKQVYTRITFKTLTHNVCEAILEGYKVESFFKDVKAVTYHQTDVKRGKDGQWETVLIFDV